VNTTPRALFLSALKGISVPRRPAANPTSVAVVGLMDAADARFPAAHRDPETMARLAAAGHRVLGFDTIAPLFSVVHESAALGCPIAWGDETTMPQAAPIWREPEEIRVPPGFLAHPGAAVPLAALRLLRTRFPEAALVGKVFGPWTLAYHAFGVSEFLIRLRLDPDGVRRILDRLKEATLLFARAQADCGVDALTLADHATSDLCSPADYRDFLLPLHRELAARISVPVILHICGNTADRLGEISRTGFAAFHYDTKVEARRARELAGERIRLVGGVNNPQTLLRGSPEDVAREVRLALAADIDMIGPECAVPLGTPVENLTALTRAVRGLG